MVEREPDQGVRLGLAGGAEPRLGVELGPAMGPVAVEVDAPGRILVELAVAVVVDPLGVLRIDRALSLGRVGLAEQSRIGRVGHQRRLAVLDPHPQDQPVAVDVVGPVLAGPAVPVTIEGLKIGAELAARAAQEAFGPVGIEPGDDMNRALLEPPPPGRVTRDLLDQGQRHLATDDVVGLQVRDDQDRRAARGGGTRLRGLAEGYQPDLAPLHRLDERIQPHPARKLRRHSPQGRGQCRVVEIALGKERGGRGRLRMSGGRRCPALLAGLVPRP